MRVDLHSPLRVRNRVVERQAALMRMDSEAAGQLLGNKLLSPYVCNWVVSGLAGLGYKKRTAQSLSLTNVWSWVYDLSQLAFAEETIEQESMPRAVHNENPIARLDNLANVIENA